jgi:very-short-patch-repair endonuclease
MMRAPLLDRARQLRRNQTRAELELWMRLRGRQLGAKFRRQIESGDTSQTSVALNGGS